MAERLHSLPVEHKNPVILFNREGEQQERLDPNYLVQSISIRKTLNKIATARIFIEDGDPLTEGFGINNSDELIPGINIEIKVGDEEEEVSLFKGKVIKNTITTNEEDESSLIIDCKDIVYKLSLSRKYRFFNDITDSEMIGKILDSHKIQSQLEPTDESHQELVQFDITDWEWIQRRASLNGKYLYNEDGVVTMAAPEVKDNARYELVFGEDIEEMEIEMDSRTQFESVKTSAFNESDLALFSVEAGPPALTELGNLSTQTLAAIGEESMDIQVQPGTVSATELQVLAEAQTVKNQLSKVRGVIKTFGTEKISPGDTILIQKVSERFNGKAFVSGVSHTITKSNWETFIQIGVSGQSTDGRAEPFVQSPDTSLGKMSGLHLGKVTALTDDSGKNSEKIKVQVPVVDNDMDGIWAKVSNIYAGKERGVSFRPELGDNVILGFIDNDPRQPIILGHLHNPDNPSPLPANDKNQEKGIFLKEGIKLFFNEVDQEIFLGVSEDPDRNNSTGISLFGTKSQVIIQDKKKNKIILDDSGITVESEGALQIKAKDKLSLTGKEISIETNGNLKCKGQNVAIEGTKIDIG